jgi:hypothetical protein
MAAPMLRDLIRSLWGNEKINENDVSDYAVAALLRLVFADKFAKQFTDIEGASDIAGIASKAIRDIPGAIAPPHFNMASMLMKDFQDFLEGESQWKSRRYTPITGPWIKDQLEDR